MRKKQKNGMLQKMLMAAVFLLVLTVIPPQTARAASGTVYTCSVTPSYSNPVTGEIEDAGGEAGYATGQGMVQSVVYSTGILEVTDSGEYYLTVRLGMMDYASGHSFWVQNVGDSGWSAPAVGQTGSGSDGNGTTADIWYSSSQRKLCGKSIHVCRADGKRGHLLFLSERIFRGKYYGYDSNYGDGSIRQQ